MTVGWPVIEYDAVLHLSRLLPGLERVLSPPQFRLQLRIVSNQHARHVIVIDPIQPSLGIDTRCVVICEEPIAP